MDHKISTAVQNLRVLWTVVPNLNRSTKISITVIYEPQYKNNLNHSTIYEPQYQISADIFELRFIFVLRL